MSAYSSPERLLRLARSNGSQVAPVAEVAAPQPVQHPPMDYARLLSGTVGSGLGWSGATALAGRVLGAAPHPVAKLIGYGVLPLAASAMAGGMTTQAVDSVAPGAHEALNHGITAAGPAGIGLGAALGAYAMLRNRKAAVPASTAITNVASHVPPVSGAVPAAAAAGRRPIGPTVLLDPRRPGPGVFHGEVRPPVEPMPGVPESPLRGYLPGSVAHLEPPVAWRGLPVHPSVRVAGAPGPVVRVEPTIRGLLPQPSLESRFGNPAEYAGAQPVHPSLMSPKQLARAALETNAAHAMHEAAIHEASLAGRGPGAILPAGIRPAPQVIHPEPIVTRPVHPELKIRYGDIGKAIEQHGPENAVARFNESAIASGHPQLNPEELAYMQVRSTSRSRTPVSQNKIQVAGLRKTNLEKADEYAKRREAHLRGEGVPIVSKPKVEVPAVVEPPVVVDRPAGSHLTGANRELFDALAGGIEKGIGGLTDTKEKHRVIANMLHGESPEMKAALLSHVKEIAPDVAERIAARRAAKNAIPEVKGDVNATGQIGQQAVGVEQHPHGNVSGKEPAAKYSDSAVGPAAGAGKVENIPVAAETQVSRKPFEKAELSVKDAVDRGLITKESDGRWYVGSGNTPHKSGADAVESYLAGSKQMDAALEQKRIADSLAKFESSKLRAVRDGDNVTVHYPNGTSEAMTMRQYRQKVFDIEDKHGSEVAMVDKSHLPVATATAPTTSRIDDLKSAIAAQGGHDANSVNDIEAIRKSMWGKHGTNTPTPREVRDTMDQMLNEAALNPVAAPHVAEPPVVRADIPKYERTTPTISENGPAREARRQQIQETGLRLRDLEKAYAKKSDEAYKTPRSHNKKKAALQAEADDLGKQVVGLRDENRRLTRQQDLEMIEDQLQNPISREHYLKSMTELHDLHRAHHSSLIDTNAKERALGRGSVAVTEEKIRHHQAESDRHALELIDSIKSKIPTDKLNKDEIQSVAEDVYRDFGHRTTLDRAIPSAIERRLAARTGYGQSDIDKLPHLDDAAKSEFQSQLNQAANRGPDWHEHSQKIIADARAANDRGATAAAERSRLAAEEMARQRAIQEAGELKESRAKNRERLSEPRYIESVDKRTKDLKGTIEKVGEGSIAHQREGVIDREHLDPTWHVEQSLQKNDKGNLEKTFRLVHTPSGLGAVTTGSSKNAKSFLTMAKDQGIDLSKYKSGEEIPKEVSQKLGRVQRAWNDNQIGHLHPEERDLALSKVAAPQSHVKADMVLGADDLGYGHEGKTHILAAKINSKLKELATEVPEFGYNPVMTVSGDKKLVFRDHYKYEFPPEVFNLHPSELTPGQTVGLNLAEMNIPRPTEAQVVASMIRDAGFHKVTVSNTGIVSAANTPTSPKFQMSHDPDNPHKWFATPGDGSENAQKVLNEIRWTQPGQDAPQRTGSGIRTVAAATPVTTKTPSKSSAKTPAKSPAKAAVAIEKLTPAKTSEKPAEKPKRKIERLTPKKTAEPEATGHSYPNPYGSTETGKKYEAAKKQNPGHIVVMRKGNFYEIFGDDAVNASKSAGLALTHLDKNSKNPLPMTGFPAKDLEGYLKKLIQKHKVSVVE